MPFVLILFSAPSEGHFTLKKPFCFQMQEKIYQKSVKILLFWKILEQFFEWVKPCWWWNAPRCHALAIHKIQQNTINHDHKRIEIPKIIYLLGLPRGACGAALARRRTEWFLGVEFAACCHWQLLITLFNRLQKNFFLLIPRSREISENDAPKNGTSPSAPRENNCPHHNSVLRP